MIIIHEGIPGAGKSYDAIRKILDALKVGRVVHTNIDGLNDEGCLEYIANYCGLTRDSLRDQLIFIDKLIILEFWLHIEDGALVVIDEAQLYFNSRDFNKEANRQISDWASTHRHHGFDVIFITQKAERIDTAVRSLAEYKYRYRKLSFLGPVKGYIVYTFIGDDPQHINFSKRSYDKKIFPAYNSYVGDATEKNFHRVPNLFKHPVFIAIPVCFAAMIYFGMSGNLFTDPLNISSKQPAKKTVINHLGRVPSSAEQQLAAFAQAEVPAVASVDSPPVAELLLFPVSAYMEMGERVMLMVDGSFIYQWSQFDKANMVVGLLASQVPAALQYKLLLDVIPSVPVDVAL